MASRLAQNRRALAASGGTTFDDRQLAAVMRASREAAVRAGGQSANAGFAVPLPRLEPQVPFGPGYPLFPSPVNPVREDTGRAEPRQREFPVSFNLPGFQDRFVPWTILRQAADRVALIRRCIELRKAEVATLDWTVTVSERAIRKAMAAAPNQNRADVEKALRERLDPQIGKYIDFWEEPDRRQGLDWTGWASKYLEEYFVLDAVAIYPRPTLGGDLYGFEIIDGSTIKLLIDQYGYRPMPPQPFAQQVLYGFPRGEFVADTEYDDDGQAIVKNPYTSDTLIYLVHNVRANSAYGMSAVEQALDDGDLWMRRHAWLKAEYTDGVMPAGWLKAGQGQADWTPEQLAQYERQLNDYYAGQTQLRQRFRILPWGMEPDERPDIAEKFQPVYDLFLLKLVAGHLDTTMAELGFTEAHGLGSSGWHQGQAEVQDRKATQPTLTRLQAACTRMSWRHLGMPKELQFKILGLEDEDAKGEDEMIGTQVTQGRATLNEARDKAGRPRYTFPEADDPFIMGQAGPVFINGSKAKADAAAAAALAPPQAPGSVGETSGGPPPRPGPPKPPAGPREGLAKAEIGAYRRWTARGRRGSFTFDHATVEEAEDAGVDLARVLFKAGGPGPKAQWAGWTKDQQLAQIYSQAIQSVLTGLASEAETGRIGGDFETRLAQALEPILRHLWTEAWYVGQVSALHQLGGLEKADAPTPPPVPPAPPPPGLYPLAASPVDWAGWIPGDPLAAASLAQGGLAQLLAQSGIVIKSIAANQVAQLGDLLAKDQAAGLPATTTARKIRAMLTHPARAEMIAQTEATRASTAAALDRYGSRGVRATRWFDAVDERVCPICRKNADHGPVPLGEPYPSGDLGPPAHPWCRCAPVPDIGDTAGLGLEKSARAVATGNESNAVRLHQYWTRGEGLGKWVEKLHPFRALRRRLAKFIPDPDELNRTTASWYHDVFGHWPGKGRGGPQLAKAEGTEPDWLSMEWASLAEAWDPAKHPKGPDGRFIRVGEAIERAVKGKGKRPGPKPEDTEELARELHGLTRDDARERLRGLKRPEIDALARHLGFAGVSGGKKDDAIDRVLGHHLVGRKHVPGPARTGPAAIDPIDPGHTHTRAKGGTLREEREARDGEVTFRIAAGKREDLPASELADRARLAAWKADAAKPGVGGEMYTYREDNVRRWERELAEAQSDLDRAERHADTAANADGLVAGSPRYDAFVQRATKYERERLARVQSGLDHYRTVLDPEQDLPRPRPGTARLAQPVDPERPLAVYGNLLTIHDSANMTHHQLQDLEAIDPEIHGFAAAHLARVRSRQTPQDPGIYVGTADVTRLDDLSYLRQHSPVAGGHAGEARTGYDQVGGVVVDGRVMAVGWSGPTGWKISHWQHHSTGRHEFGHLFDAALANDTGAIRQPVGSERSRFKAIHTDVVREAIALDPYLTGGSRSTQRGRQEAFAEIFDSYSRIEPHHGTTPDEIRAARVTSIARRLHVTEESGIAQRAVAYMDSLYAEAKQRGTSV